MSRITGADKLTTSVLPDREAFSGQTVPNHISSAIKRPPSQTSQGRLDSYSSVFESFDSNGSVKDADDIKFSHENPSGTSTPAPKESVKSNNKGRFKQSMSADSALLPTYTGPFPDNEYPDSSPGSLRQSPVRKKSHSDTIHPQTQSASPANVDYTKKDPFGSLVSLHDDIE